MNTEQYKFKLERAYRDVFRSTPNSYESAEVHLEGALKRRQGELLTLLERKLPEFYWHVDMQMHRAGSSSIKLFTIVISCHRKAFYVHGQQRDIHPRAQEVRFVHGGRDYTVELKRHGTHFHLDDGAWLTDWVYLFDWLGKAERAVLDLGMFVTIEDQLLWLLRNGEARPENTILAQLKAQPYNQPFPFSAYGEAVHDLIRNGLLVESGERVRLISTPKN